METHKCIIKFRYRDNLLELEKFLNKNNYEYHIEINNRLFDNKRMERIIFVWENWNYNKTAYKNYLALKRKGYSLKKTQFYKDIQYLIKLSYHEEAAGYKDEKGTK